MINTNQINTVRAVHELLEEVACSDRRLVYWIGAGASAWADYPLWKELSEIAHRISHVMNQATVLKMG